LWKTFNAWDDEPLLITGMIDASLLVIVNSREMKDGRFAIEKVRVEFVFVVCHTI
jgi:hypothetical protein